MLLWLKRVINLKKEDVQSMVNELLRAKLAFEKAEKEHDEKEKLMNERNTELRSRVEKALGQSK